MLLSQQATVQKVVESDILINENELQKLTKMHQMSIEYMNQDQQVDQQFIEKNLGKTYAFKKQPNPIEQAFLSWYATLFGDEWKIIADVINYHPFTRGSLREPDELARYFYAYSDQKGHMFIQKM